MTGTNPARTERRNRRWLIFASLYLVWTIVAAAIWPRLVASWLNVVAGCSLVSFWLLMRAEGRKRGS